MSFTFANFIRYHKSIEIYEDIARQSLSNNLLKYGVKGHLLNAGICQLCRGDVVAINKALERYQVHLLFLHTYLQHSTFWMYVMNIFSVFVGIGSYIFWNKGVQIACGMSWLLRITFVFSFLFTCSLCVHFPSLNLCIAFSYVMSWLLIYIEQLFVERYVDWVSHPLHVPKVAVSSDIMSRYTCGSQDLAAAIDEEDVAKFTDAVKEFDSMTQLVSVCPFLKTLFWYFLFILFMNILCMFVSNLMYGPLSSSDNCLMYFF